MADVGRLLSRLTIFLTSIVLCERLKLMRSIVVPGLVPSEYFMSFRFFLLDVR